LESDNWIVQQLQNALDTWNDRLAIIWRLLSQSPETFRGGGIWDVIVDIHGALQAIGYALLVLFFVVGVVKTCGSFTEIKKPEHALKLFIRFALAKGTSGSASRLLPPGRLGKTPLLMERHKQNRPFQPRPAWMNWTAGRLSWKRLSPIPS